MPSTPARTRPSFQTPLVPSLSRPGMHCALTASWPYLSALQANRTRDFPKHMLNFPAPKPLFLPHPLRTTFLIQTPPSLQEPAPQRPPHQPGQNWSQPPLQPGPSGLPIMGPATPCIHHPVVGCVLVSSPNSPHQPPWGKTQIIHVCVPAPHLRTSASLCNCQSPFVHR